jgi:hypothetical protein
MSKAEEILDYMRGIAYPYYNNVEGYYKSDRENSFFNGLLHSMTIDDLQQMMQLMEGDGHPYLLHLKIKGIIKSKEREQMKVIPTLSLLDWYKDKSRKYRSKASAELMKRYSQEGLDTQRAILEAFMDGGVKEMEWAARHLRDAWTESFKEVVKRRWEQTQNKVLGHVILRHFNDSYIMENHEELAKSVGYANVCARVGADPSFAMDSSRLSIPDHFYVAAKLDLPVKCENMEILLNRFLDSPYVDPGELGLICWALGKLHMTYVLMRCGQKIIYNAK